MLSIEDILHELSKNVDNMNFTVAQRVVINSKLEELRSLLTDVPQVKEADIDTSAKLQVWERKLLDLSLRNNLLNMKLGKKAVEFTPCPISELEDLLADGKEYSIDLSIINEKIIKSISRTARTMTEETGVNALFITIGTLNYDNLQAPILLLPIDIVTLGKHQYAIRGREEDARLNSTLVEYLKQNYEIDLKVGEMSDNNEPVLPHDNHGIDVNLVLHQVRKSIVDKPEWTVEENSIIGIFSFAKYVMWNDIHTHGNVIGEHTLLRSLVEGRLLLNDDIEPANASLIDESVSPEEIALPLPFDSSQMEAVVDATNGMSFVLYGPPGTGKSQTITNIIANAMYHGKRVLFVAQKKAALEVVQRRLDSLGLSEFCLELHSDKANKNSFLRQMQQLLDIAISNQDNSSKFREHSRQLFAKRMELNGIVKAVGKKHKSGYTLQECFSLANKIKIPAIKIPATLASDMNHERAEFLYKKCCDMDASEGALGISPSEHPLRELSPDSQVRDIKKAIAQDLRYLLQSIENVQRQANSNFNLKFAKKTERELLENDYRWKHFAKMAHPAESLLEDFAQLKEAVTRWSENINLFDQWMDYNKPFESLRQIGLGEAVERYMLGGKGHEVAQAVMKGVYECIAKQIINDTPELSAFNALQFEHTIEQYRELCKEYMKLTKEELRNRMIANIPISKRDADVSSELTLLRKRIASKGRGTSIRGIIEQMPHLLPVMSPCMLMSPLSVAQHLDINGPKFDLVIFDEASQMPTSEAVGAIARGNAVIVVGDPQQMPPTSFFSISTDEDDVMLDDLDSILDDCISLSMPARYLSWHYRSKHESLIDFSNHNYYGGNLFTFPSADDKVSHVTYEHIDGIYDYGNTRTNQIEAQAVVNETIERLRAAVAENTIPSIGIVAFSKQQSDLIEDLLGEELAKDATLNNLARSGEEPIFIKNLENVQGDERDVILFSVGYGPDKDGRLSLNFGPLNQAGGERRLNVAVSRAKKEMKIFSSITPEQIDERRTQAEGVLGLKRFMAFAASGQMPSKVLNQEEEDEMIQDISSRIKELGFDVDNNVGRSSFRVDIAVVDPINSERYILGIICDQDNYRRLKTAHDREVTQPGVLKSLGWHLMHVWQIDWFLRPEWVVQHIQGKLEQITKF